MESPGSAILSPIALRLGRVDEVAADLADACFDYVTSESVQFDARHDDGYEELYVSSIAPVPPIVSLLVSDALHQIRSALDNAVVLLIEHVRAEALEPEALAKSKFIISERSEWYERSVQRVHGLLPELGPDHPIGEAIFEMQPFRPLERIRRMRQRRADSAPVHHLLALQGYSNADKHHHLRALATGNARVESMTGKAEVFAVPTMLQVGMTLSRTRIGETDYVDTAPYICMERPISGELVPPGAELNELHRYVAEVAINRLAKAADVHGVLPPAVDLRGRGMTDDERLATAGSTYAHDRKGRQFAEEAAGREQEVRVPDLYRRIWGAGEVSD